MTEYMVSQIMTAISKVDIPVDPKDSKQDCIDQMIATIKSLEDKYSDVNRLVGLINNNIKHDWDKCCTHLICHISDNIFVPTKGDYDSVDLVQHEQELSLSYCYRNGIYYWIVPVSKLDNSVIATFRVNVFSPGGTIMNLKRASFEIPFLYDLISLKKCTIPTEVREIYSGNILQTKLIIDYKSDIILHRKKPMSTPNYARPTQSSTAKAINQNFALIVKYPGNQNQVDSMNPSFDDIRQLIQQLESHLLRKVPEVLLVSNEKKRRIEDLRKYLNHQQCQTEKDILNPNSVQKLLLDFEEKAAQLLEKIETCIKTFPGDFNSTVITQELAECSYFSLRELVFLQNDFINIVRKYLKQLVDTLQSSKFLPENDIINNTDPGSFAFTYSIDTSEPLNQLIRRLRMLQNDMLDHNVNINLMGLLFSLGCRAALITCESTFEKCSNEIKFTETVVDKLISNHDGLETSKYVRLLDGLTTVLDRRCQKMRNLNLSNNRATEFAALCKLDSSYASSDLFVSVDVRGAFDQVLKILKNGNSVEFESSYLTIDFGTLRTQKKIESRTFAIQNCTDVQANVLIERSQINAQQLELTETILSVNPYPHIRIRKDNKSIVVLSLNCNISEGDHSFGLRIIVGNSTCCIRVKVRIETLRITLDCSKVEFGKLFRNATDSPTRSIKLTNESSLGCGVKVTITASSNINDDEKYNITVDNAVKGVLSMFFEPKATQEITLRLNTSLITLSPLFLCISLGLESKHYFPLEAEIIEPCFCIENSGIRTERYIGKLPIFTIQSKMRQIPLVMESQDGGSVSLMPAAFYLTDNITTMLEVVSTFASKNKAAIYELTLSTTESRSEKLVRLSEHEQNRKVKFSRPTSGFGSIVCSGCGPQQRIPIGSAIWPHLLELPPADIGHSSHIYVKLSNYSCIPLPFRFKFNDSRFTLLPSEGIVPIGFIFSLRLHFAGASVESVYKTVLSGHVGFSKQNIHVSCSVFKFKLSLAPSQRQANLISLSSELMIGEIKEYHFSIYVSNRSVGPVVIFPPKNQSTVTFPNDQSSYTIQPTISKTNSRLGFSNDTDTPEKVNLVMRPTKVQNGEEIKFFMPIQNGNYLECSYTVKINSPGMDIKLPQYLHKHSRVYEISNLSTNADFIFDIAITNNDYLVFTVDYVAGISGVQENSIVLEEIRDKRPTVPIPGKLFAYNPKNKSKPVWKLKFRTLSNPSPLLIIVTFIVRNSFHTSCKGDIVKGRHESFLIHGNVVCDSVSPAKVLALSKCSVLHAIPWNIVSLALKGNLNSDVQYSAATFAWAICSAINIVTVPADSSFNSIITILKPYLEDNVDVQQIFQSEAATMRSLRNQVNCSNRFIYFLAESVLNENTLSVIKLIGDGFLSLHIQRNLEDYVKEFSSSSSIDCWNQFCNAILFKDSASSFGDIFEESVGSLSKASKILKPVTDLLRFLERGSYSNSQIIINSLCVQENLDKSKSIDDFDMFLLEYLTNPNPTGAEIIKFLLRRTGFDCVLKELECPSTQRNMLALVLLFNQILKLTDKPQDECMCLLKGVYSFYSRPTRADAMSHFFAASGDEVFFDAVFKKFITQDCLFGPDLIDAVCASIDFLVRNETYEVKDIADSLKRLFQHESLSDLKQRVERHTISNIFTSLSNFIPESQLSECYQCLKQTITYLWCDGFQSSYLKTFCVNMSKILVQLSPLSETTKSQYTTVYSELTSGIPYLLYNLRNSFCPSVTEVLKQFVGILKYSPAKPMVAIINFKSSIIAAAAAPCGASDGLHFIEALRDNFPSCAWLQHASKMLNGLFLDINSTQAPFTIIRFAEFCALRQTSSGTVSDGLYHSLHSWLLDVNANPNEPHLWLESYYNRGLLLPTSRILILFEKLGNPRSHNISEIVDTLIILFGMEPIYGNYPKHFDVSISFLYTILRTRELAILGNEDLTFRKGLFLSLLGLLQLESFDLLDQSKVTVKNEYGSFDFSTASADNVQANYVETALTDNVFDSDELSRVPVTIEAARGDYLKCEQSFELHADFTVGILIGMENSNFESLFEEIVLSVEDIKLKLEISHKELRISEIIKNNAINPLRGTDILDCILTVTAAASQWRSSFFKLCRISRMGWFEGNDSKKASNAFLYLIQGIQILCLLDMIRLRLQNCAKKAADVIIAFEAESMRRYFQNLNIKDLDKNLLRVLSDLGISRTDENLLDWMDTRLIEDKSSEQKEIVINLDDDIISKETDDLLFDSQLDLLGENSKGRNGMISDTDGMQSLLSTKLPKRLNKIDVLGGTVGTNELGVPNQESQKNVNWKKKEYGGNDESRRIHKNIGKVTIRTAQLEEMGIEGSYIDTRLDGEEETRVQVMGDVTIKLDRTAIQNKLKGTDLYAIYSRQKLVNRSNGQALTVPKEFQDAIEKQEKWTYRLLAQNPAIDGMIEIIIENVRLLQIALTAASSSDITADIEWILLFDNSGSMVQIGDSCAEILAVLAEVLRKLEFRFAVGTLGAHARLIKTLDEPFTHVVGERILACFSFNERTNILSSTEEILEKVFPQVTTDSPKRILVCVTDGFANELICQNGWENIKDSDENAKIAFLHTISSDQKSLQDYMKVVTKGLYFPINQDVLINVPSVLNRAVPSNKGDGMCAALNKMVLQCIESCLRGSNPQIHPRGKHFMQMSADNLKSVMEISTPRNHRDTTLYPLDEVVDIDVVSALNNGSGMRPENMFKVSLPSVVSFDEDEVEDTNEQHSYSITVDSEIHCTEEFLKKISLWDSTNDAQRIWIGASKKLRSTINELVSAFEDFVFPFNIHTRRKPDFKGSQFHLQGLMKAEITDFTYKKIYSTKSAGGMRDYSVCILVDVSQSMDGHLLHSALESLVLIAESLVEMKLGEFGLILFGSNVQLIKDASQVWSKEHILSLLAPGRIQCTDHTSTRDGEAIKLGSYILQKTSSKLKKMIVLTDGFSSNGKETLLSLKRARDAGIDVIGVGVGMCKTNVQDLYHNWISAALPRALPSAFRELYSTDRDSMAFIQVGSNKEINTWRKAEMLKGTPSESVASILRDSTDRFDELQSLMKDCRELSLVRGNCPGAIIVDLVFVVDCTGSMKPMLSKIKSDIHSIAIGGNTKESMSIIQRVEEKFPGNKIQMRCGLVEFRDTCGDDIVPLKVHEGRDAGVAGNFFNLAYDSETKTEEVAGQRAAFEEALQTLQAHGGGDLAEDLPVPLLRIGNWMDWKGQARFVLLFTDAPPHGSDFHSQDFIAKGIMGDSAAERSAKTTKEFETAFNALISKNVKTFLCTCNNHATDTMFKRMQRIVVKIGTEIEKFKATAEGRPERARPSKEIAEDYLKEIRIFQVPSGSTVPGMHVIFILDDSGSMSGSPWNDLTLAYKAFLRKRVSDQGGQGDMVSIVIFNSSSRIVGPIIQPIKNAPKHLDYNGGGTCFLPAMLDGEKCLNETPLNKCPVVVFMSDGESDDYEQAADVSLRMFANCDAKNVSLQIHTIAFGSGAKRDALKKVATRRGKFHNAPTGFDLQETFKVIAANAGPSDTIFKEVGSRIAEAVTDKLTIEYF